MKQKCIVCLSVIVTVAATVRADQFELITGVDPLKYPGTDRMVTPSPGPGFDGLFNDGDRLAGTGDVGPTVTFLGVGTPFYDPNEFGSLSFTYRRGSIPLIFPPNHYIPLQGIDFLGGPLLDLDGDLFNGTRSLVPVIGMTPVEITGSFSFIDLTLNTSGGTVTLNNFDATGSNEGGPGIQAEIATTLTTIAGTEPDGMLTGAINPGIDTRTGTLASYTGTSGTLTGVYRIEDLGYELWQDSIDPNSSSASVLGTFQFLGSFDGWYIERDSVSGQFPTLTGEGLGSTLWPLVDGSEVGNTFNTANGLAGGSATITTGPVQDDFTVAGNGGVAMSDFGGDLGGYFDSVVAPLVDPSSDAIVYLEGVGFGINNSSDPVYTDTVSYDVVVVAQQKATSSGLVLDPPTPGLAGQNNTLHVSGATPGERIYYVYGLQSGSTSIPGCGGEVVDIDSAQLLGFDDADGSGLADFDVFVPNAASGVTVYLQAVEQSSCTVSNLVIYTFP